MLEMVTGGMWRMPDDLTPLHARICKACMHVYKYEQVRHFTERRNGAPPMPGYQCHETMNHLEYFVFDAESTAEPPRPTHRLLPCFAVSWRAIRNDRAGIVHEGH